MCGVDKRNNIARANDWNCLLSVMSILSKKLPSLRCLGKTQQRNTLAHSHLMAHEVNSWWPKDTVRYRSGEYEVFQIILIVFSSSSV